MKKVDIQGGALPRYSVNPAQNMFDDTMMRRLYICMGWFIWDAIFFIGALLKGNADKWIMFNIFAFFGVLVFVTVKHWPEKEAPDKTDGDE